MRRLALSFAAAVLLAPAGAWASACFGVSDAPAPPYASLVKKAQFAPGNLSEGEVGITFIGHATFRIETPQGVIVATDYAGSSGPGPTPNVVTMNNAHETHFTDQIPSETVHTLRGWGDGETPAAHEVRFRDMRIRNVTTDLLYGVRRVEDGNSIFVFEVGDLCIGHLGHLHHLPTAEQFAQVGFLDVVFAPVDGVYTMSLDEMITTLKTLRARVVIPMHFWSTYSLTPFLDGMRDQFAVEIRDDPRLKASKASLPDTATVVVLPMLNTPRFD
ncbi:MAG: MBL fold metallo-hydrolase [Pseudomonadota bacterium]